jgi:hypothetical protein
MIHPLLRLVVSQPNLLADHADAYTGLVSDSIGRTAASLKQRAVLGAVALGLLVVAAVLAGVALMLWAVMPAANIQAPWALIAAPAVPALIAIACALVAKQKPADTFAEVKRQFAADMVMLREVSAT